MSAVIYLDSKTGKVTTTNPNTGQETPRPVIEMAAPEGSSIMELLGALNGWTKGNIDLMRAGITPAGTIVKVTFG